MPVQPRLRSLALASVLVVCFSTHATAQAFPPPPAAAEVDEIRNAVVAMKAAERGPYERLRWHCSDGTAHPPQGTPCATRGGGVQHAEPSAAALRLAERGFHIGTILQAMDYAAFADEPRGGYRLREMVLERYLIAVDDGWVMRRARYYRGALQIEDEERSGRALLERRFADGAWLRTNYLLASRLAASLPHVGLADDRTLDRIRTTASQISAVDEGFMRVRVKIHSVPSRDDVEVVRSYLVSRTHEPAVRDRLIQLHEDLVRHYDPERALSSLSSYEARFGGYLARDLGRLRAALAGSDHERVLAEIVAVAPRVREAAERSADGARALDLIDLGLSLQERAFVVADELDRVSPADTRAGALGRLGQYLTLAYAAGYLSHRELAALREEADALIAEETPTAGAYKTSLAYLGRSLDWARGTVRGTFAPVLERYTLVEPAAAGLADALLRGSVLLPLSRVLDALHADADRALGATDAIFDATDASGVRGLNPGVALGPLAVLEPGHHDDVDQGTIYVLPETPPELKPVAGVLTLDEGNLLSHVQLLARNLGIPNATLPPGLEHHFRQAEGEEVFYAVTPLGRVIVKRLTELDARERALVDAEEPARSERHRLDTSRLRLGVRRPVPLAELRATDSGVLVGPKAANLGQLAADFPGRVSPAVALPFGMFVAHVDRPYGGTRLTVLEELQAAYGRAADMRAQGAPEPEVDAFMLERLAWVREAIEGLDWIPTARSQVAAAVVEMLGGDVRKGVFVRSDTNVEDLPQFSGAGLNLTVAHQTELSNILAAIKRVWTSPFSERAYLWRRQILQEQGNVYPSVLLQETVPSERSGVLITTGLEGGDADDLTVVAAEGVGGAVDGEDAETLLIRPNGDVRLLSQAKAPRRREVVTGGTRWIAAQRPETLLQEAEIDQLRDVVGTWKSKKEGTSDEDTVWDIEYGFVEGRLWLFQIRPFIRFRNSELYIRLQALDADAAANSRRLIDLSHPLVSP